MSVTHADVNYLMEMLGLDYEVYGELTMLQKLSKIRDQLRVKLHPTQPTLVDLCLGDEAAAAELAKAVGSFRQSGTPVMTSACVIDVVKGMIRQRDVAHEERENREAHAGECERALRRVEKADLQLRLQLNRALRRVEMLETVVADHAIQQMLDDKLLTEEADDAED